MSTDWRIANEKLLLQEEGSAAKQAGIYLKKCYKGWKATKVPKLGPALLSAATSNSGQSKLRRCQSTSLVSLRSRQQKKK